MEDIRSTVQRMFHMLQEGIQYNSSIGLDLGNGTNSTNWTLQISEQIKLFSDYNPVTYICLLIFIIIYLCLALAIVSEYYFVPAIETCSSEWSISKDVAGATIMAISASCPQLAFNFIGDLVTFDGVGIGGVIGSAFFTALFIPSVCGLISKEEWKLDRVGIVRDCLFFIIVSVNLAFIIFHKDVTWWLAGITCGLYILYVVFILFQIHFKTDSSERSPILANDVDSLKAEDDPSKQSLIKRPDNVCFCILWVISLPIIILYYFTIPSYTRKCCGGSKICLLTIIMSVFYVGLISYFLLNAIELLGSTLNINSMIQGVFLLALGGSIPDLINSVISVRHGNTMLGISNSMGSLVFDLTICIGLPWLIFDMKYNSDFSYNLDNYIYIIICLIISCIMILFTYCVSGFVLNKTVSTIFLIIYIVDMILIITFNY